MLRKNRKAYKRRDKAEEKNIFKYYFPNVNLEKTGQNIRHLMEEKGITVNFLHEVLNVSPQAISKWLNGRSFCDIDNLIALSCILKTPLDKILVLDNPIELTRRGSYYEDFESVR